MIFDVLSVQEVEMPLPTLLGVSVDMYALFHCPPCRSTRSITQENLAITGVLVQRKLQRDRHHWDFGIKCITSVKESACQIAVQD